MPRRCHTMHVTIKCLVLLKETQNCTFSEGGTNYPDKHWQADLTVYSPIMSTDSPANPVTVGNPNNETARDHELLCCSTAK